MEEDAKKIKILKIIVAVLLLLLVGGTTALGATLISMNRQPHPTVQVPVQTETTAPETTVAPTTQAETTEATEGETTETTVPETTEAKKTDKKTDTKKSDKKKTTETQTEPATQLQLHKRQDTDNVAFQVQNMFPGDQITKHYCVRVAYSHNVTLHFRADVRKGYEKLAEALKCRVMQGKIELYNGLMADMPKSLDTPLKTTSRVTTDVVYDVTVYLDTSVDNPYQGKELWADFRWWIEDKDALADLPKTADEMRLTLLSAVAIGSLLALIALLVLLGRKEPRLARLLGTLIVLALLLSGVGISAYAATWLQVDVKDHYFHTGTVKINLNNCDPIITEEIRDRFPRFEPGMTVKAPFFLKNQSTDDVYYKLYLTDVKGDLADVLEITFKDTDGTILYSGSMRDCTRLGVGQATAKLDKDETKNLTAYFYFPREAGNDYQNKNLEFKLCADAVQTRNNEDKTFPVTIPTTEAQPTP